jgi:allantoinase
VGVPELVVLGGTVVTSAGMRRADVVVRDGEIMRIGPNAGDGIDATSTADATGLLVLPGFVDTHVHLMDPGATEREDFPTGTSAAAARGVTTVVEHTHAAPVRSPDELRGKIEAVRGRSNVDFGLAAHVWPDRLDLLVPTWKAGATFFKIFTCATHGVPAVEGEDLRTAFATIASVEGRCLVHCEDETMTSLSEQTLRGQARTDPGVLVEWRSRDAELAAVTAVCDLAAQTSVAATVAHVSQPEVARVIEQARSRGADLAAEACPQYLLLTEDEVLEHGAFRKFTPPARARDQAQLDAMWDLLADGVLTHVSTDHAPATREQKLAGDIWGAPFGLPGLDTTSRMLFDAVARGRLTWSEVALRYAEAPARRYGFEGKGRIEVGASADLVLVDADATVEIRDEDVISKAGWTPFAGRVTKGDVVATFLRGKEVAREGACIGARTGRFLPGPGARMEVRP